jgi:WD40 repeat protein/predicted Ser/Thr protein kinase
MKNRALIERLQDDQAHRWRDGDHVLVEAYLQAHPALRADHEGLLDLINHEVLVREASGERPHLEEYQRRFPELKGPLRELFEVHAVLEAEVPPATGSAASALATGPFDGTAAADQTLPADLPGYEILRELGRGGMGVVYLAWQAGLKRLAALKMIRGGDAATPEARARFHTEVEAVARLEHPNIVRIYEVGEQDGRPYFAHEYVDGGSLTAQLQGVPQPPRRAADLVETLARAVHLAHQRGVVHRDLTPNNVLLSGTGQPKIADFGLAKLLVGEGCAQTQSGAILGTPSYMAPEQALGHSKAVGPATDVYALGAILYEALTGRPPFAGETPLDTLRQVIEADPVPPRRLQPKVPPDLETICDHCLHKDAARRYPSAEALADDLRRFLNAEPIRARPVSARERAVKWARRRPAVAGLLALSLLLALGGFGLVTWQWREVSEARDSAVNAWESEKAQHAETDQARQAEQRQRAAADLARQREGEERLRFQVLSASLLRDQGLRLCGEGDCGRGLLFLDRALQLAPPEDPGLCHAIRTNLAAWQGEVHPVKALLGHDGGALAASWSGDGRVIATSGRDRKVRLWESPSGRLLRTISCNHTVTAVALSPDGKTLLTAARETAQLYEVATGASLGKPLKHDAPILALAFSPDGKQVLTGDKGGAVHVWEAAAGRWLKGPFQHGGPVRVLAFHPRSSTTFLASGEDGRAYVWNTATGQKLPEALVHDKKITAAAYSPDGRTIVTASADYTARLWEAATGLPVNGAAVIRHAGAIKAVAFSPDSRWVVTGGSDREARLWGARTGTPLRRPLVTTGPVEAVAVSPDGYTVLTGSADQRACLWDAATGEMLGSALPHQSEVIRVALSPDSATVLTLSRDRAVRLWQTAVLQPPRAPLRVGSVVTAVALSPDGRTALTGSVGGRVERWDVATGASTDMPPLEHPMQIRSLAFSPDGETIVTGCEDKLARLWHAATGVVLPNRFPHPDRVRAVSLSPDGQILLTGCEDGHARLWAMSTGKLLKRQPNKHGAAVYAAVFSPDGRRFLTGSEDRIAQLWDTASAKPIGPPLVHHGTIRSVAFSPDGKTLLTGAADRTARLWWAESGQPLGPPLLHPHNVLAVAFGVDGRMILTGCQDGLARLWDAAGLRPLGRSFRHRNAVNGVALGRDGTVLTGSADGTARLWTVPQPLSEEAHRISARVKGLVGMELDVAGAVVALDLEGWQRQLRP